MECRQSDYQQSRAIDEVNANKLVLENMRLVYYFVHKIPYYSKDEEEDLISIGMIGLIKASRTFDESKSTFATYAMKCIRNEVYYYLRKTKPCTISLSEPISADNDDIELEDMLEDSSSLNFVESLEAREILEKSISIIFNLFIPMERNAMLYDISNWQQWRIAKEIGISQGHISRILKKCRKELKEYLDGQIHYERKVIVLVTETEIKVIFPFGEELKKRILKNAEGVLQEARVIWNDKYITIEVPAIQSSFALIAMLLKDVDEDFDKANRDVRKNNRIVDKKKYVKKGLSSNSNTKNAKVEDMRLYFLSLETFSVADLRSKFFDIDVHSINSALQYAKNRGLIYPAARGVYIVNKDAV